MIAQVLCCQATADMRTHRGSSFAVVVVLKHGVTKEALLRPLDSNEVDQMDFHGGFEPRQAYDSFISIPRPGVGTCVDYVRRASKHTGRTRKTRRVTSVNFTLAWGDPYRIWCVV
jgi:hypothetical protein